MAVIILMDIKDLMAFAVWNVCNSPSSCNNVLDQINLSEWSESLTDKITSTVIHMIVEAHGVNPFKVKVILKPIKVMITCKKWKFISQKKKWM